MTGRPESDAGTEVDDADAGAGDVAAVPGADADADGDADEDRAVPTDVASVADVEVDRLAGGGTLDGGAPRAPDPSSADGRWAAIGGFVSFAYVIWYVIDLALVRTNPIAFNAAHRIYGNLAVRAVFAVVFGAVVFHGLDGLRRTAVDHVTAVRHHELVARTVVRFVTFAVWIPAVLVLIWPAIRDWFSR